MWFLALPRAHERSAGATRILCRGRHPHLANSSCHSKAEEWKKCAFRAQPPVAPASYGQQGPYWGRAPAVPRLRMPFILKKAAFQWQGLKAEVCWMDPFQRQEASRWCFSTRVPARCGHVSRTRCGHLYVGNATWSPLLLPPALSSRSCQGDRPWQPSILGLLSSLVSLLLWGGLHDLCGQRQAFLWALWMGTSLETVMMQQSRIWFLSLLFTLFI